MLLSIAQRGLKNLNEDQLMEEAMRVSLKSQKLEEEEEDAIKDANIRSLMGKRRNTSCSSPRLVVCALTNLFSP